MAIVWDQTWSFFGFLHSTPVWSLSQTPQGVCFYCGVWDSDHTGVECKKPKKDHVWSQTIAKFPELQANVPVAAAS
ncbi:MAG: hypothetical protein AAFQ62_16740, partial [Pseudomonadota bacterium]